MMRIGMSLVVLALGLTACNERADVATQQGQFQQAMQDGPPVGMQGQPPVQMQPVAQPGARQGGLPQMPQGDPQQALQGLGQIRQQQCQSGNQLACQAMPALSGVQQQLNEAAQACRSGNPQACGAYQQLSQRIFTAYAESAQVMQQGAQGAAQMNAWRNQMNGNHANNMAALNAQAAAGQAAHNARQGAYAAQNQTWANGQASQARGHGRYVDSIYGGTTMDGGGVQTFVPYGQTGYTDGYGNVATGAEGGEAPAGWQEMNPTYAAPD